MRRKLANSPSVAQNSSATIVWFENMIMMTDGGFTFYLLLLFISESGPPIFGDNQKWAFGVETP